MPRPLSITILIVFVSISGCINPFAPRLGEALEAELCTDLTSVENVFCVFRNAYSFRDTTLYSSIISPSFSFVYTDYDRAVDVTWGRDDELRSTYGLFQSVQSLTLTWNNLLTSEGNDTLWKAIRSFNLTVTFNPSDITRIDGYANMTFARPSRDADWQIVRWRDESNY
jgi:hypothetical protein